MTKRMRHLRAVLAASAVAVLIQPLLDAAWIALQPGVAREIPWEQALLVGAWVLFVATLFVVVLGLPAFLILKRLGRIRVAELGAAGFLLASVPVAVLTWPLWKFGDGNYSSGGNWYGHYVDFIINGEPTLYGWLAYCQAVLVFGMHGLAGALAFRAVWHRLAKMPPQPEAVDGRPS